MFNNAREANVNLIGMPFKLKQTHPLADVVATIKL